MDTEERPRRVEAERVVELLAASRVPGPAAVAFDADGTLWAGDVGEDVFEHAYGNELIRDAAREDLLRVATAHGLGASGSASALAKAIHAGYRRGVVAELLTCEVMTWSYAGYSVSELSALAREALVARDLVGRRRQVLGQIFEYVRRERLRTFVISASPLAIVQEGLRLLGIEVDAVGAAEPVVVSGRIQAALAHPVPYGPEKPVVGKRLLEAHDWLASFGDNVFDLEMLRIARIGVAVHPKPALASRLGELTNTVVLE